MLQCAQWTTCSNFPNNAITCAYWVEKVFLCATVGALAHAGRLAELYNLLTASTGLWEAHQIVFLFLDSVESIEQYFVQKCRENL